MIKQHGLRGSELENRINMTIDYYREDNLGLIQKIPTPITPISISNTKKQITSAYFAKKSTVDYIGVVQGVPVCFDAKEVSTDNFPLKNIHEHQYEFMKDFEKQEGVSFLLIYFKKREIVHYMTFKELNKFYKNKKYTKSTFNFEDLNKSYNIDIKNSLYVPFLKMLQKDLDKR